MASLFQSLRWVHIAAGSIALILFWIPAIAPKGGRTHIRAGWFYVVCMSVVVVTAFHSCCRSADRAAAFAGRALGFFAGATRLCHLPGLLGWHHPGVGLARNLGGRDQARSESDAHALQSGAQRGGTPRGFDRARPRNQVSQRAADWPQSHWPLHWSWKFALLAAWSTITDALVVRASWLDDRHGHRRLHGLPGVWRLAAVSFVRPKPDVHAFLDTAQPDRRAGHLHDGCLLSTQIPRS
jgi:hypothetical protein